MNVNCVFILKHTLFVAFLNDVIFTKSRVKATSCSSQSSALSILQGHNTSTNRVAWFWSHSHMSCLGISRSRSSRNLMTCSLLWPLFHFNNWLQGAYVLIMVQEFPTSSVVRFSQYYVLIGSSHSFLPHLLIFHIDQLVHLPSVSFVGINFIFREQFCLFSCQLHHGVVFR